jgi:hypothetical protein
MRKLTIIAGLLAIGLAAGVTRTLFERVDLPPRADPWPVSEDPGCVQATSRPPDYVFNGPPRHILANVPPVPVRFADLPNSLEFRQVRMSGFLHVEFEHVALYSSWEQATAGSHNGLWLSLDPLFPHWAYWQSPGTDITDRCARVEAELLAVPSSRRSRCIGRLDVTRLEVWSKPYRPLTAAR